MRQNHSGFTPIEFIIGLAVIAIIAFAIYTYQNGDLPSPTPQDYNQTETDPSTPEQLPTDSSDDTLNQTLEELNQLTNEIETLNTSGEDATLPDVDFPQE